MIARKPSTVSVGTAYEMAVHHTLARQLQFELSRVGGAHDRGVDLMGVTRTPHRLSLVIQCKCESKKLSPRHVRELQGTLVQHLDSSGTTMALLASSQGFTSKTVAEALASRLPLSLVHIATNGTLHNCIFNNAASELLSKAGLQLVKRFSNTGSVNSSTNGIGLVISLEQTDAST